MKGKPGRPKKNKESFANEKEAKGPQTEVLEQSAPVDAVPVVEKKEVKEPRDIRKIMASLPKDDGDYIAESRKALETPLAVGQQFFEAPDGEILIGEADKTAMWSRRMNGGRGGWVNPRR